jgi:hypothetical protein
VELKAGNKGVYVGESSRSMYERGKEHLKDGKERAEDSHKWKHWALDHPEILLFCIVLKTNCK